MLGLLVFLGLLTGCSFGLKSSSAPAPAPTPSTSTSTWTRLSYEGESDPISFHFLELGNAYAGDSVLIQAGDMDILIDAGSRYGSYASLSSAINEYVSDGKLEYVIATHAHQDHIAAFSNASAKTSGNGIFYHYQVGTVIDFGQSKVTTSVYSNYKSALDYALSVSPGSSHFSAAQCVEANDTGTYEDQKPHRLYSLGKGLSMEVLDHKFNFAPPSASDENDNSVCLLFHQGQDNHFLFTGDLEKEGISSLIEKNSLPHCRLFKAGHHGSINAVSKELLDAITPETIVVCACCGVSEYTDNPDTVFPYQETIDLMSPYTENIFATSCGSFSGKKGSVGEASPLNGRVSLVYLDGTPSLTCSASSLPLKDSEWFNRTNDLYAGSDPTRPNRVWKAESSLYDASIFQGEKQ